jgi:hypothetical protein
LLDGELFEGELFGGAESDGGTLGSLQALPRQIAIEASASRSDWFLRIGLAEFRQLFMNLIGQSREAGFW